MKIYPNKTIMPKWRKSKFGILYNLHFIENCHNCLPNNFSRRKRKMDLSFCSFQEMSSLIAFVLFCTQSEQCGFVFQSDLLTCSPAFSYLVFLYNLKSYLSSSLQVRSRTGTQNLCSLLLLYSVIFSSLKQTVVLFIIANKIRKN